MPQWGPIEGVDLSQVLRAEMVASVHSVVATVGEEVGGGDILVILESMKMEISVFSPCSGTVTQLLKTDGARVQAGQTLVVLES